MNVLEVAASLYTSSVPGGRCGHTLGLNNLVDYFKLDHSKPCQEQLRNKGQLLLGLHEALYLEKN